MSDGEAGCFSIKSGYTLPLPIMIAYFVQKVKFEVWNLRLFYKGFLGFYGGLWLLSSFWLCILYGL